jgi:hypothetical protein
MMNAFADHLQDGIVSGYSDAEFLTLMIAAAGPQPGR